jgi:hypothetical protein
MFSITPYIRASLVRLALAAWHLLFGLQMQYSSFFFKKIGLSNLGKHLVMVKECLQGFLVCFVLRLLDLSNLLCIYRCVNDGDMPGFKFHLQLCIICDKDKVKHAHAYNLWASVNNIGPASHMHIIQSLGPTIIMVFGCAREMHCHMPRYSSLDIPLRVHNKSNKRALSFSEWWGFVVEDLV